MTDWLAALYAVALPCLRRRDVLELAALIAVLPACKDREPPKETTTPLPTPPTAVPAGALDPAAYRTLEAAVARILPARGSFPGAREAGVIVFVDRQLAVEPLRRLAPAFTALARALDGAARTRKATDFATLPENAQNQLLDALSRGALETKLPEAALFRALHSLTLEGFLCDPVHGGNRDQIGWRAIEFPEPLLRAPGRHGGHGVGSG